MVASSPLPSTASRTGPGGASRSSAAAEVAAVRNAVTSWPSTKPAMRLVWRSHKTITYSAPGSGADGAMAISLAPK